MIAELSTMTVLRLGAEIVAELLALAVLPARSETIRAYGDATRARLPRGPWRGDLRSLPAEGPDGRPRIERLLARSRGVGAH